MNINPKIQRQLKIQNIFFYLLLIVVVVLIAQLSLKTNVRSDWTVNNRHSLSETSITFLKQLDQQVTIQAFISPSDEYRPTLEALLTRYQRHSKNLNVVYINPDFSPDRVRDLNIQQQGEMVVTLGEQQQHVYDIYI